RRGPFQSPNARLLAEAAGAGKTHLSLAASSGSPAVPALSPREERIRQCSWKKCSPALVLCASAVEVKQEGSRKMRSNRRRNWFIKRIALGLAIAAVAAPVAQAKVEEGSRVRA